MVWELDAAATAQCYHVAVYRRCSTADAVADTTEYSLQKFLERLGGTTFSKYAHGEIPNST